MIKDALTRRSPSQGDRSKRRIGALAGTAVLAAAGGVIMAAGPASAQLTTTCVGTADSVTIPGDLVVAKNTTCELTNVTVTGNAKVATGANLIISNSTLQGTVTVAANGYFDSTGSSVAGNVKLNGAYGAYLDTTTLSTSVVSNAGSDDSIQTFVYLTGSNVTKGVTANTGDNLLADSTVGTAVTADSADYFDVDNSTVGGKLTVTNAAEGSAVTDSEVYGDVTYTGNSTVIQLGGNAPVATSTGSNYFDKDVTISNNTADISLVQNIIRGDLSGTGNDPAPTLGDGNRVRGTISGQFAGDSGASTNAVAGKSKLSTLASTKSASHASQLQAQVSQRRGAAESSAAAAGPAQIAS